MGGPGLTLALAPTPTPTLTLTLTPTPTPIRWVGRALLRGHRSGSERPPPDYSSDADAAGGEGGSGAPSPPLPGEDGDEDGLWADMLHPSQRFHTELSVAMLATFNRARGLD